MEIVLTTMVISDNAMALPFCRETWLTWDAAARSGRIYQLPLGLRKLFAKRWSRPWVYHEEWYLGQHFKIVFHGIRILIYQGSWRGGSHNLVGEVFYDANLPEARKYAEDIAMGSFLSKLKEAAAKKVANAVCEDKETRKRWPSIVDFLTLTKDGKEEREPGQIFIRWAKGEYGICLTDPTNEITAWYNVSELLPGLDELEGRLKDADLDWRASKPWGGASKGKKKG